MGENFLEKFDEKKFDEFHIRLDNVRIGNLRRKNRDHRSTYKQDEDAGNLQILLHLRSQDEDAGNLQILLHLRSPFRLHGQHSICYYTICYVSSYY